MYRFLLLAWVTFILHFQPSSASWNAPLVGRHLEMPQRRQTCDEGTGVSNQDQIISDACNANAQNDYWTCYNQLVLYIRQSAANTCSLRYTTYNGCVAKNKSDPSACVDAKAAWDGCSNYAVDIYKYCGCWYTMPADLYDCANVILEIRPNAPVLSTIPTTLILSTALLTGPILPASATNTAVAVSVVTIEPQPLQSAGVTQYVTAIAAPYYSSYPVPLPLITPTIIRPLPLISSEATSTSKTTTTLISQTTRTFTTTITTCPPVVTDCPQGYSSYSIYTSTIHQTIYSCDGGCDEAAAPPKQVCVPRKRVRAVKRGEL